jgi:hypothetical protein
MTTDEEQEITLRQEEEQNNPQDILREIHQHMDELQRNRQNRDEDPDKPTAPEELGVSVIKYHKGAEVARRLDEKFTPNVFIYGSHVVNSNTKRIDNLRHLGEYDSTRLVMHIPYLRSRGTDTKIRTTGEFQMCRSNAEVGGFDQKMSHTNIQKEDVDLRQSQNINRDGQKKKGGILGFLHIGKKE